MDVDLKLTFGHLAIGLTSEAPDEEILLMVEYRVP